MKKLILILFLVLPLYAANTFNPIEINDDMTEEEKWDTTNDNLKKLERIINSTGETADDTMERNVIETYVVHDLTQIDNPEQTTKINALEVELQDLKNNLNSAQSNLQSSINQTNNKIDSTAGILSESIEEVNVKTDKNKYSLFNMYKLINVSDNVETVLCTSTGTYASSLGYGSSSMGYCSTAIGLYCTAIGDQSSAFGNSNTTYGDYSNAFGYNNTTYGDYSNAFGGSNIANGDYSNAFGDGNTTNGNYANVFGNNNTASERSNVFGKDNTDNGTGGSLIIGTDNTIFAGGSYGYIFGNNNGTHEAAALCIGTLNNAYGTSSMSMGIINTSSGICAMVSGASSIADGRVAFAQGELAKAQADYARASGREITVSGEYSYGIALNDQNGATLSQANTMSIMGGKVGIENLTPTTTLDVNGGIKASTFTLTGLLTGTTGYFHQIRAVDANGLKLYEDGGSGIFVEDGGNVGIGTTNPTEKLNVSGNILATGGGIRAGYSLSCYNDLYLFDSATFTDYVSMTALNEGTNGTKLYINTKIDGGAQTTKMTILGNGNVGIGTTNPTSPFYCVGNAYFTLDVSALTFTDRTTYPKTKTEAYDAVMSMEGNGGEVDYNKLDKLLKKEFKEDKYDPVTDSTTTVTTYGRDLTMTVSAHNELIKDLYLEIESLKTSNNLLLGMIDELEKRIEKLEKE